MFFTVLVASPPPPLLRGDFPEATTAGKICLLLPVATWQAREEQAKVMGMQVAGSAIQIFYVWYHNRKVQTLIHRLCPNMRMSCIGKYKRNVLDYQNTAILSIISSLLQLLSIINEELFSIFEITPGLVFIIDSICDMLFYYVLPFCLALLFINADLPSRGEVSRRTQFYVRRPEVLEPRHPLVCSSANTLGLQLEQNLASCSVKGKSMGNARPGAHYNTLHYNSHHVSPSLKLLSGQAWGRVV